MYFNTARKSIIDCPLRLQQLCQLCDNFSPIRSTRLVEQVLRRNDSRYQQPRIAARREVWSTSDERLLWQKVYFHFASVLPDKVLQRRRENASERFLT